MTPVIPKKALGQHFLADENILRVIERLSDIHEDDVVLEIGPGLGVLTRFLAARAGHVHAVELDRSLEVPLRRALAGLTNVTVTFGDALRIDMGALEPTPSKLVANLPYNIATPLVVESFQRLPSVRDWCVMVQREVADRFFASPSTKDYGAVSVIVQLAARRTGFHPVSRHVFRPQPKVDSALVAMSRVPASPLTAELKRLVEAAFSHRRKTLANALELSGKAPRAATVAALDSLGLAADVRAETLTPMQFVALSRALRENGSAASGLARGTTAEGEPEGAGWS